MSKPAVRIDHLSRAERLALLEQLWESLEGVDADFPVTDVQRHELDRRLDAMDDELARGVDLGIAWDEVRARLQKGH